LERLTFEIFPPRDHVSPGNAGEVFRLNHADETHKANQVGLVGASGVRIGEIGQPFEKVGDPVQGLELGQGQPPFCGFLNGHFLRLH